MTGIWHESDRYIGIYITYIVLMPRNMTNEHKLKIRKIYDLIPSNLENKKKRIVYKNIEEKKGKTFSDYADEFEYLINSGVALEVSAISNPTSHL